MTRAAEDGTADRQTLFTGKLARVAADINGTLDTLLPVPDGPERRLVDAMRHGALDGGKRLRPFLVSESASLFGVEAAASVRAAAALEMIHCYSLIHDDLPAMDDDDLRRGRPTVHKAFDEATAILAGDGLLTKAFAVLADPSTHADATVRLELIEVVSDAAGVEGMIGGQMLDLLAEQEPNAPADVERLQTLKTGRLITAACECGAIIGQAGASQRQALRAYGTNLGRAFQIADDLIDVEVPVEEAGKATGKDDAAGKATFVSLLGPERARKQAKALADQAVLALADFGAEADCLRDAAAFVIDRRQ